MANDNSVSDNSNDNSASNDSNDNSASDDSNDDLANDNSNNEEHECEVGVHYSYHAKKVKAHAAKHKKSEESVIEVEGELS